MTMPRHLCDRSAGSQVSGLASSPSDNAWNVNFDTGNINRNNRNNNNRALAVCRPLPASESQGVTYKELCQALVKARHGKVASANQLRFDYRWMDNLLELQHQLNSFTYPTHARVRRRVLKHAESALQAWSEEHLHRNAAIGTPEDFRKLESIWASYVGHFRHANAHRLSERMLARRPWLVSLTNSRRRFHHSLSGQRLTLRISHV